MRRRPITNAEFVDSLRDFLDLDPLPQTREAQPIDQARADASRRYYEAHKAERRAAQRVRQAAYRAKLRGEQCAA